MTEFIGEFLIVIFALVMQVVIALLTGLVVMLLWNWLIPSIFGLGVINYFQGWGLVLLTTILFKSDNSSSK